MMRHLNSPSSFSLSLIHTPFHGPFLWAEFHHFKAEEQLEEKTLILTKESPGAPVTHLVDLRGMKD